MFSLFFIYLTSFMSIFAQAQIESTKARLSKSIFSQEGLEIEYDIREDDEQTLKEVQIIDLFVAAGYFRARIKGLSSFDKIVGGMVWCISLSNFEVDVDLLFQENSSIGFKISVTEKIVSLLPTMQCPHRLEPHQIQGLDCIHIFPVVQWLVRKAIETRKELGNTIRSFSVYMFSKEFSSNSTNEFIDTNPIIDNVNTFRSQLNPNRKFKKSLIHQIDGGAKSRVIMTLLEYGYSTKVSRYIQSEHTPSSDHKTSSMQSRVNFLVSSKSFNTDGLLQDMSEIKEGTSNLSKNKIGSIFSLHRNSIFEYSQNYSALKTQNTSQLGLTNIRVVASLKKQLAIQESNFHKCNLALNEVNRKLEIRKSELLLNSQEGALLEKTLKCLEEKENDVNTSLLQRITELVSIHEQLKKQERQFEHHSKEEFNRITLKIDSIRFHTLEGQSEDNSDLFQLREQRNLDDQKYSRARNILAKKTREIAILQRKLDDCPSRAELAQYQRRFVELHKQVSSTLTETRQYFTLYNTLNDTQIFLDKESQLLNLLYDKFDSAMTSNNNKEIYFKHLDQFLDETQTNLERLELKKQSKKGDKDLLNDSLLLFLDQQRQYSKLVRDFGEQIRRNEELNNQQRTS